MAKRKKRQTRMAYHAELKEAAPTDHLPGSAAKVEEMRRRLERGEELHASGDILSDPSQHTSYERSRNGQDVNLGTTEEVRPDPGERKQRIVEDKKPLWDNEYIVRESQKRLTRRLPMAALELPEEAKKFGPRLRQLRISSGYSQEDLAIISGVSASSISYIENGARPLTSYYILWLLADALKVTLDDLVGRKPPR